MSADDEDAEFSAMQTVYSTLKALPSDAQERVLGYVTSRLGMTPTKPQRTVVDQTSPENDDEEQTEEKASEPDQFSSFAELFDAAQPRSNDEKALVAGYWLQICEGADSFDGFSVNKELKHLGQGLTHVSSAFDTLKGKKPALALQLKKSGKTRQARKTYKITVAGVRAVEAMIRG